MPARHRTTPLLAAALVLLACGAADADPAGPDAPAPAPAASPASAAAGPLDPPRLGDIRVAFLVSPGSNVIDMAGPWEVFQDVDVEWRGDAFELYTVAETREPVRLTGGLRVTPDYSVADAPAPHVVVIPAMRGSAAVHDWLRRVAPSADVVMSVCTGAFQLARAGLLDGRRATTHHDFWDDFAREFPRVTLVRGERWVESDERISTAGGLTSGIDLALRVVERYFGRETAQRTARYMEYRSPYLDIGLETASSAPASQ
jgi:transcriptional regulator GlxA family with amidase domain